MYEIFLSYNTVDGRWAQRIAEHLRETNRAPYYAPWTIKPGASFILSIEEAIRDCSCMMVLVGTEGFGPWQERERQLAEVRAASDPDFRIIPVLLPGADPSLTLLNLYSHIELPNEASPEQSDQSIRLIEAALGGRLDVDQAVPFEGERVCPFRGLLSFREEDSAFFFGRSEATKALLSRVRSNPMVAVVGPSGSGKSSLVNAGLFPALRSDADGRWALIRMVPGDRPFRALATALLPAWMPHEWLGLDPEEQLRRIGEVATRIEGGEDSDYDLAAAVRRILEQSNSDRMLLFIDQLEELYTPEVDLKTRDAFLGVLSETVGRAPLSVVFTARGAAFGSMLEHPALGPLLQEAGYLLPSMSDEELEEAIRGPAEAVKLAFDKDLVTTLVRDVSGHPGALPLLEHTLRALWSESQGGQLSSDTYEQIGFVEGSLGRMANRVFSRLTDAERSAAKGLFLRLMRRTDRGDLSVDQPGSLTNPYSRFADRRIRADKLKPIERRVVKRFTEARLLVTRWDPGIGAEMVEMAHGSLVAHWNQVEEWIRESPEYFDRREVLEAAYTLYCQAGTLLKGRLLDQAIELGRSGAGAMGELDEFIRLSARARRADRAKMAGTAAATFAALIGMGMVTNGLYEAGVHRAHLERIGVPPALLDRQKGLDSLGISGLTLETLEWLDGGITQVSLEVAPEARLARLENVRGISVSFPGRGLASMPTLPEGLLQADVNLRGHQALSSLESLPRSLQTLSLDLRRTELRLPDLPERLRRLSLDIRGSRSSIPDLPVGLSVLELKLDTVDAAAATLLSGLPASVEELSLGWLGTKFVGLPRLPSTLRRLSVDLRPPTPVGELSRVVGGPLDVLRVRAFSFQLPLIGDAFPTTQRLEVEIVEPIAEAEQEFPDGVTALVLDLTRLDVVSQESLIGRVPVTVDYLSLSLRVSSQQPFPRLPREVSSLSLAVDDALPRLLLPPRLKSLQLIVAERAMPGLDRWLAELPRDLKSLDLRVEGEVPFALDRLPSSLVALELEVPAFEALDLLAIPEGVRRLNLRYASNQERIDYLPPFPRSISSLGLSLVNPKW